jgi:rSAM/selenodomain-associated transferase 1
MAQPALMIFAKQPRPGQAKTRLQPEYTPEQAAEIAALLIRETVELAVASWPGATYLCTAPNADHPLFRDLAKLGVVLIEQGEGDLGARMHRAVAFGIEHHGAAAVLGCDVPHCPWEILDDANTALARGDNVLGPTDDGGYYLIGLSRTCEELFAGIAWGGPYVLSATLERAQAVDIDFTLLASLRDIDTAADLWLAAREHPSLRRFL